MHEKPIALICFSMNLYFCHTPLAVWNQLSILRFVISRTTTMQLYKLGMTIPVYVRLDWKQHDTTCVIGADNMTYITHMHAPMLDKSGTVKYTKVYNTINIYKKFPTTPITNYDKPERRMLPNILPTNVERIKDSIVFGEAKAHKWQNSSWAHAVDIITHDKHLHAYPELDKEFVEPPNIHIHQPLHDVSTSAYKDVIVLLT